MCGERLGLGASETRGELAVFVVAGYTGAAGSGDIGLDRLSASECFHIGNVLCRFGFVTVMAVYFVHCQ